MSKRKRAKKAQATMENSRCYKCHGPQHPATGWHFAPGVDYCGRCAREFAAWYRERMAPRLPRNPERRRSSIEFYDAAASSVRPA
jgi:hypothetical protein